MKSLTYTEAREHLADTIKAVCGDHAPVIITRKREDAVVMMSLADYESLTETAYLLRSPRNAERLMAAVAQVNAGKGHKYVLKDGKLVPIAADRTRQASRKSAN